MTDHTIDYAVLKETLEQMLLHVTLRLSPLRGSRSKCNKPLVLFKTSVTKHVTLCNATSRTRAAFSCARFGTVVLAASRKVRAVTPFVTLRTSVRYTFCYTFTRT